MFADKSQKLPKCNLNTDRTYDDLTILQLLKIVKERFDDNDITYRDIFDIINRRLTDIDNTINRHNECSPNKCLKRKDGSICQNCKYRFPLEVRKDSKMSMKYYDNIMILAELISPSNDA